MTTNDDLTPALPEPNRAWRFDLVLPFLSRPRRTLQRIAGIIRPAWRVPIALLLLTIIIHAIVGGTINAQAKASGELVLPPGYEYYTPEQQAQYQQAATATNNPAFNYVLPALGASLGLLFGWMALAWLLHLVLTLSGGRGTSQSAVNVTAWASLPLLFRYALQIIAMLISGRAISGQGLSGFAPAGEGFVNALLGGMLGQIDIFLVWMLVLLIIGMSYSSQLRPARVAAAVIMTTLVVMALRALPTAILSLFGDLTIIQPFF